MPESQLEICHEAGVVKTDEGAVVAIVLEAEPRGPSGLRTGRSPMQKRGPQQRRGPDRDANNRLGAERGVPCELGRGTRQRLDVVVRRVERDAGIAGGRRGAALACDAIANSRPTIAGTHLMLAPPLDHTR